MHLAFAISDSAVYQRIKADGAQITRRYITAAVLLSAALILAFLAVLALFRGQVRLVEENEKIGRMAYVGTLASGLAHEIRNPLNAMSLHLGVIEEDLEDPREDSSERVGQIVRRLSAEVGQLDDAVSHFLAFALPQNRPRKRTRLADVARQSLASGRGELAKRDVRTVLELDEEAEIEGNPTGLRQVFHNLALNAAQAMNGPGGRLRVRLWREGHRARVAFEDTGRGIEPDRLEWIFGAFHSGRAGGAGFGLAIARRIVQDHNGRIWAESTPGKGSTFHLEFPLVSGEREV
jgi:two-component system sensor histidine kinase HydH